MTKVDQHIKQMMLQFPSLFPNRIKCLRQLFLVNGNGYDWDDNGCLVSWSYENDRVRAEDKMHYDDLDTRGNDRDGNECMMIVRNDPTASGCNPFYWDASPYNRFGHEFASQEEAETQAKYARGSWSVKSVDTDSIKIGAVHFKVIKKAINMGNVA